MVPRNSTQFYVELTECIRSNKASIQLYHSSESATLVDAMHKFIRRPNKVMVVGDVSQQQGRNIRYTPRSIFLKKTRGCPQDVP